MLIVTYEAKRIATVALKKLEGCNLIPYLDKAGVLTNGYGNTHNVPDTEISQSQAEFGLITNVDRAAYELSQHVTFRQLHDHEVAALICFVFNCGAGNWRIWKYLNAGQIDKIPDELMRFDHATVHGKLVEVTGLTNRRKAEVVIWNTADPNNIQTTSVIAPNSLNVQPKPDPKVIQQEQNGMQIVAISGIIAGTSLLGRLFKLNPTEVFGIVGFITGCGFTFIFALVLYFINRKKEPKKMAVSQAFTDALTALQAAYQAEIDTANKAAQDAVTNADADAVAAIKAATPVAPTAIDPATGQPVT